MIRTIRVTDSQLAHGRVVRRHLDGRMTVVDGTKRMTGYPLRPSLLDRCLGMGARLLAVAVTVAFGVAVIVSVVRAMTVIVTVVRITGRGGDRRFRLPFPIRECDAPGLALEAQPVRGEPVAEEVGLHRRGGRDQPDRLLSNVQLKGRDGELPFILQFNPDAFPAGQRVELRGRVTRAGQLIMRLPPRTISSAASQALGPLQLVPAP